MKNVFLKRTSQKVRFIMILKNLFLKKKLYTNVFIK